MLLHLEDRALAPAYYDAIITGDLGSFGSEMLWELSSDAGIPLESVHKDCGTLIFEPSQKLNCGGSGCGCSAVVLAAHLLPMLEKSAYRRILFLATGALMSPFASMQGESIPGIAHAIVLERE